MTAVLLDTCAIVWLAAGLAPKPLVAEAIEAARRDDAVLVSAMSAWEIAQKHRRRPTDLGLTVEPLAFWRRFTDQPGVRVAQLTAEVLVASVAINGLETKDPVDRMLVATAEGDRGAPDHGRRPHPRLSRHGSALRLRRVARRRCHVKGPPPRRAPSAGSQTGSQREGRAIEFRTQAIDSADPLPVMALGARARYAFVPVQ
mgnify:CR=1 FL=1